MCAQIEKALLLSQLSASELDREQRSAEWEQRRSEWEQDMAAMAQTIDSQRSEAERARTVSDGLPADGASVPLPVCAFSRALHAVFVLFRCCLPSQSAAERIAALEKRVAELSAEKDEAVAEVKGLTRRLSHIDHIQNRVEKVAADDRAISPSRLLRPFHIADQSPSYPRVVVCDSCPPRPRC